MTDSNPVESGSDTLRVYEVGYLLLSSIPEEKVPDEVSRIKASIESRGGTIISGENPELRTLAYTMEKHIGTRNERFTSAYFGFVAFEITAAEAVVVKKEIDSLESVLRFLMIKTTREIALAPKKMVKEIEKGEEEASSEKSIEASELE